MQQLAATGYQIERGVHACVMSPGGGERGVEKVHSSNA